MGGVGVGFLRYTRRGLIFLSDSGSPIESFYILHSQLVPVEMIVSFELFMETENSCFVPRFPLIAGCYEILDSQISFIHVMLRSSSRSRKFWKGRCWSRTFYHLRIRDPDAEDITPCDPRGWTLMPGIYTVHVNELGMSAGTFSLPTPQERTLLQSPPRTQFVSIQRSRL